MLGVETDRVCTPLHRNAGGALMNHRSMQRLGGLRVFRRTANADAGRDLDRVLVNLKRGCQCLDYFFCHGTYVCSVGYSMKYHGEFVATQARNCIDLSHASEHRRG